MPSVLFPPHYPARKGHPKGLALTFDGDLSTGSEFSDTNARASSNRKAPSTDAFEVGPNFIQQDDKLAALAWAQALDGNL